MIAQRRVSVFVIVFMGALDSSPLFTFSSVKEWEQWLLKNYTSPLGVWVRFFKKSSGKKTFGYKEALDVALCYGWIDGIVRKYDEESYIQRFTQRRARSMWSKVNIEHTKRLISEGKMHPSGLAEIKRAKKDGRWDTAYDSSKNMSVPEDFLKELAKDKKAQEFFQRLNKSNAYAIAWRLNTAKKPETRERRMKVILAMMRKGKKLY
jgi:uncharacterized protein YdeI (YjbR/CyaY-like superfamily)